LCKQCFQDPSEAEVEEEVLDSSDADDDDDSGGRGGGLFSNVVLNPGKCIV
jgi:hypothetical protein